MEPEAVKSDQVRASFERYELPLFRLAKRIVGDSDKARDVVQETFLRLCKVGEESIRGGVPEWLFTVCRNRAVDVRRRERRLRPMSEETMASPNMEDESAPRLMQHKRDVNRLVELVAELPAKQRRMIVMRFHHGWSYRQISEATGLSTSNVGYQIHTGVKLLRKRLERGARRTGETK